MKVPNLKYFLLCSLITVNMYAENVPMFRAIDARFNVNYVDSHQTFFDGDSVVGFVKFLDGFTAQGDLSLGALFPIDGNINLHETKEVTLTSNITFGPRAKIPNGGVINGNKKTIFLMGNLTIPANKTLRITENLTIDGNGHRIIVEEGARIIIDGPAGTKFTLRNLTIIGNKDDDDGNPSLTFGDAENQILKLDNVLFFLGGNYTFDGGKLRIKGLVMICGDLVLFQYRSPYNIIVYEFSTLFIDLVSGFYYNPRDRKQTHLVMKDQTARLVLNGCSFFVSGKTGLMLTTGHLIVDHSVVMRNLNATTKNKGLILGSGNPNEDLVIDILPGANIDIAEGFLTYRNSE